MIHRYYESEDIRAIVGVYAEFHVVQAVDRVLDHAKRRMEGWERC